MLSRLGVFFFERERERESKREGGTLPRFYIELFSTLFASLGGGNSSVDRAVE